MVKIFGAENFDYPDQTKNSREKTAWLPCPAVHVTK